MKPFSLSLPTVGLDLAAQLEELSARILHPNARRVVVVPGLPGTSLGRRGPFGDDVTWLDLSAIRGGRLAELEVTEGAPALAPLGLLTAVYGQLHLRLRLAGFHVIEHAFDWRRSLVALGAELRDRLLAEPRPVTIVAHSFGGLVARAAIRAGARNVDKVILLGTPNQGTFAVVQALRGEHWMLRLLGALDGKHDARDLARRVFSSFPSIYEQLPSRSAPDELDFHAPESWPTEGPGPRPALLAAAASVRASLAEAEGRFVMIAGHGYPTVERAVREGAGLRYEGSTAGDGWVAARHAPLPGSPCYFAEAAHVGMANHPGVLAAVLDLLEGDHTEALPTSCPPGDPIPAETDASPRTGDELREADLARLTAQITNL